jgi:hypothetical protein
MIEITDRFEVLIFDEGRNFRDFESGVVVVSIIFEHINTRGEFTLKDESFMGSDYPSIDVGIEYAETYSEFLKALKKVMSKLELEGYRTKIISNDIKTTKLTIHKPRISTQG